MQRGGEQERRAAAGTGAGPRQAGTGLRPAVVVTGGSSGIGLALARELAALGLDIVMVARDEGRLQAAHRALAAVARAPVHAVALDLSSREAAGVLLDRLAAMGLATEHLIVNAASATAAPFAATEPAALRAGLELNVAATAELMHRVLPSMIARRSGGILCVASLAGLVPFPGLAAYGASKAFLISLATSLAEEVRGSGVKVAVLVPGPVDTAFLQRAGQTRRSVFDLVRSMRAETVARVGCEGYLGGRLIIVPGLINMIYYWGLQLLPRRVLARIVGLLSGGMR